MTDHWLLMSSAPLPPPLRSWCNTLLNPDIVIYIPINQKSNQGVSTGLMSLLMFRTRGAVHQSVSSLPSVWPSTFRPLWYTPVEQPRPSSPPQPCSPVSSVPVLLSSAHSLPSLMFPYFGLDGEEWPPHHHNSWIPPPSPSRYSTPNTPGIRGIVYVSGVFILLSCCCNYWNAEGVIITAPVAPLIRSEDSGPELAEFLHSDRTLRSRSFTFWGAERHTQFWSCSLCAGQICTSSMSPCGFWVMSHGPSLDAHFSTRSIQDTSAD